MFVEGSHNRTVTLQRITSPKEQRSGLAGSLGVLLVLKTSPRRTSKRRENASAEHPTQTEASGAGASKHPGSPGCSHVSDTRAKRHGAPCNATL